jgi:SMC interacting uncharacterized protein involved in chromosome segregation
MPERDERIDRLEKEFSAFHSDLKYIGKSVDKMANAMESLVTMQSDIRLMEERAETRHTAQKLANDLLHKRIDHQNLLLKETNTKAENGNLIYKVFINLAKTVGALMITTIFGIIIWALKAQG